MTENEAIHELNTQIMVLEDMILYNKDFEPKSDNSSLEIRKEAIEIAVQSLTEIQQYRAIGTVEECRAAVERMKPKKPIIKSWSPARCPSCDSSLSESLGDGYYKHHTHLKWCDCGQKLDWSESEERC